MKIPKTSDIVGIINKIAPFPLAEPWDNSGLQVGEPHAEIHGVMVALDPLPEVIKAAIDSSCQLLVTHHPLLFKPKKSITIATSPGRQIYSAIRGGLSIVSMHTSYDIATGGLNDLLARKIGVEDCSPLQETTRQELVKLALFVPEGYLEPMQAALFPYAEQLGNYRDCSFTVSGKGTFTPLEGARPFSGTVGVRQSLPEQRLELLFDRKNLPRAIKTLLAAHPYEEPAFDVYPLLNEGGKLGLGRIGHLPEAVTLEEFAGRVRSVLSASGLRYAGDPSVKVSKVALCSGSGSSLLRDASRAGADVLVTGDVKYHDARDAQELGIAVVDAGHFPTEIIMVDEIAGCLERALADAGYGQCRVHACRCETDPFRT